MHHSTHRKRALFSSFCARPMVRFLFLALAISSSFVAAALVAESAVLMAANGNNE